MKAIEAIKELIKKSGLTKARIARAAGISPQSLEVRLSRDNPNIATSTLVQLCNAMDYDVVLVPKSRSEKAGGIILD